MFVLFQGYKPGPPSQRNLAMAMEMPFPNAIYTISCLAKLHTNCLHGIGIVYTQCRTEHNHLVFAFRILYFFKV